MTHETAYARAGVDIAAGDRAVGCNRAVMRAGVGLCIFGVCFDCGDSVAGPLDSHEGVIHVCGGLLERFEVGCRRCPHHGDRKALRLDRSKGVFAGRMRRA